MKNRCSNSLTHKYKYYMQVYGRVSVYEKEKEERQTDRFTKVQTYIQRVERRREGGLGKKAKRRREGEKTDRGRCERIKNESSQSRVIARERKRTQEVKGSVWGVCLRRF